MATKKTDKASKAAKAVTTKGAKGAASKTAKTTRASAKPKLVKAKAPAKQAKAAPVKAGPRHPRGRVLEAYGSKASLAKSVAAVIARADQDANQVEDQLKKASNKQLLRLAAISETVKKRWGDRDKLIAAIGTATNKSKDKDYLAKLATFSLPQLVDLAKAAERAVRPAS